MNSDIRVGDILSLNVDNKNQLDGDVTLDNQPYLGISAPVDRVRVMYQAFHVNLDASPLSASW
jgi:hypothetical protein